MAFREAPTLETERLVLRAYQLEDFEAFAAYFASPRSHFTDGPIARELAWDLYTAGAGRWVMAGHGAWTITRRGDDTSLGLVSLNTAISLPACELGWILWEGSERQGYAFEAACAARGFAFSALGMETLLSGIHHENSRSIKLAMRMGAVRDPSVALADESETLLYRHLTA